MSALVFLYAGSSAVYCLKHAREWAAFVNFASYEQPLVRKASNVVIHLALSSTNLIVLLYLQNGLHRLFW